MQLQRRPGSGHEVLLGPGGAKGSDPQGAALIDWRIECKRIVQKIHVRKVGARCLVRLTDPFDKLAGVPGDFEVQGTQFGVDVLPHKLYTVGVGLQKSDIGMAIDSELDMVVFVHQLLYVSRWNPGSGDFDMCDTLIVLFMSVVLSKEIVQFCHTQNWQNCAFDSMTL